MKDLTDKLFSAEHEILYFLMSMSRELDRLNQYNFVEDADKLLHEIRTFMYKSQLSLVEIMTNEAKI